MILSLDQLLKFKQNYSPKCLQIEVPNILCTNSCRIPSKRHLLAQTNELDICQEQILSNLRYELRITDTNKLIIVCFFA